MSSNNNSDMIDMQDKMGYVDTGPTLQPPNPPYQPVATSTSAHLIIKEPKPQRQLNIPTEPKKKVNGYKPEPAEPRTEKNPEKNPEKRVTYEPTEKSPRYTNREEIKEMMVHKLYELADMLNSLNIDEPAYGPRPTPSKSDPQQQIKRRPSKGKNASPENNRHLYNKSLEYNEPIYTHRPYYTYYDHPPRQQQEMIYDDDDYYQRDEPYTKPYFQPQSSTYVPRPRRKSYSNLRDEEQQQHARLVRKTSRSNLARHAHTRPPPQVTYDPRYDSYQPDMVPPPSRYHPSYYHPSYSPDDYY